MMQARNLAAGALAAGLVHSGAAQADQQACRADVISRPSPATAVAGPDGVPIELEGDQIESVKKDTVTMRGNAQLKRGREAVFADELTYYRATDEVEGKGNVTLYSLMGDRLKASYMRFQVETHIGEADDVQYRIANREATPEDPNQTFVRARGEADKLYMEGHDVTRLENVYYTTCAEGNDDVIVSAKDLTIDQGTGEGVARNVKVRFKNVPIFYFPRLSFPINDERKTGFLFPSFGSEENSGFVLTTPYYWNIAPNYDATFYPRLYTKRGVQLGAEGRYLTRKSNGVLYGEYLPSDNEFNDEDRWFYSFDHDQKFAPRWTGFINVEDVSDSQYFDDFSNDIQVSSASTLPQRAEVNYRGPAWRLTGRVFSYKVIDDRVSGFNEPYDRLPQFKASADYDLPAGLDFRFDGEAVNFTHDERIEGWRYDARPALKRKFRTVWGYVQPKATLRYTTYSLDNVAEGDNDTPSSAVPIFSLDSGVFFERRSGWLGMPFVQTLEPRAFYVYIPEDNQDELPNFDTSALNLNNFNNIYRENRFFGNDRVGDTNQVTLGLTSRLLHAESGREWMRASIGQIFFLEDRKVNLNPDQVLTANESDLLGEVRWQLTNSWSTYGFVQWDNDQSEVREGKFDVTYRTGPRQFVNLEYRFSRDFLEQVSIYSEWPLAQRWQMFFDERYSLEDDENLETKVGLEYDGCCWRIRGFGQRRAQTDGTFRNALIFEFELTGLARIRAGL